MSGDRFVSSVLITNGLRRPKGRKQSLLRDDRHVSPDSWDDIPFDKAKSGPIRKVIKSLRHEGVATDIIIEKIMNRFNLTYTDAEEALKVL